MEQFTPIINKVNEISVQLGFREFNFTADKYETASRALIRFIKAMNKKIERNEIEDTKEIKIKLDFVSSLIRKVNSVKLSENPEVEKLKFIEEGTLESLYEFHKNRLVKYFTLKLAKEIKFNYAMLKNYYLFQANHENAEGAKEKLEELKSLHKTVNETAESLAATTLDNLEEKIIVKDALVKTAPDLFNTELVEQATTVSKLNKDKIDELYKQQAEARANAKAKKFEGKSKPARPAKGKAKKTIDMSKVKTNTVKTAYEDKGAENNPFASLFNNK